MGVKVTLQRFDRNGEAVVRTFDEGAAWKFIEDGSVHTLKVTKSGDASGSIYGAEFLVECIESVEFV